MASTPAGGTRRPGIPTYSRRIGDQFDIVPQPPGCALGLSGHPPAIAIGVQYHSPVGHGRSLRSGGPFGRGPVLGYSAAANFGLRDPNPGATALVLEPTDSAPVFGKLEHLVAMALREAACDPARFRESGLDVYLYAPDPVGFPASHSFRLPPGPFPRVSRRRVSNLAGGHFSVPLTVYDVTPSVTRMGLRDMQILTGTSRPGPRHVGDVRQDMEALWGSDLQEYRTVAAHQACLVLFWGCELGRLWK